MTVAAYSSRAFSANLMKIIDKFSLLILVNVRRVALLLSKVSENYLQYFLRRDKMNTDDKEDVTIYKVVVNHEEQYSIWPAQRENPLGWQDAGKSGLKSECLEYIKEVWTDMRPLSLRKKMEQAAQ